MPGTFFEESGGEVQLLTRDRHYVAFIRKKIDGGPTWVLFNDEKVVKAGDVEEMKKFAYIYFLRRV